MASSFIPNSGGLDLIPSRDSKRKKLRKLGTGNEMEQVKLRQSKWRTQTEQQIYSAKLVDALCRVRRGSNTQPTPAASCITVHETADRVLAAAAKGRTRWSRAILTTRLSGKMKRMKKKFQKPKKMKFTGDIRSKQSAAEKRLPTLERKARVLGRLVPGCSKLSFPNLLDEATDYIAALEMQVRAMTALTGLLTGADSLAAPSDRLGSNPS